MATLLFAACSSSDDDNTSNTTDGTTTLPTPAAGTDQRPDWQAPHYSLFEGMTMSVQIGLQKELLPYVSENDLMCAVMSDEVRAVTNVKETGGQYYFPLSVLGSSNEGAVTLKYYCDKLHRIFTVADWMEFDSSIQPTNGGMPYEVQFYTGN